MSNRTAEQIDSPGRRAAAYWFIDGLPEIVFGFAMLIPGLCLAWFPARGNPYRQNWWIWVGLIAAVMLFMVILLMHRRILDYLKARITYPRTGYVCPPADLWNKSIFFTTTLILGTEVEVDKNGSSFLRHTMNLFILGFVLVGFLRSRWLLALVMPGIAAAVYFRNRDDVRPYSWRAVLPIALAGIIAADLYLTPKALCLVPLLTGGA
jgi:hypothetical protein